MLAHKRFAAGFVQLAILALILAPRPADCASSIVSSKEELQSPGEKEGIVFGSVVITVEKGQETESGLAFLEGRRPDDAEYAVWITEAPSGVGVAAELVNLLIPTMTNHGFTIKPGQEVTFLKKLPAGAYRVSKLQQLGFSNFQMDPAVGFTVTPGRITYVGRLTVVFPHRVTSVSQITARVTDAQEDAINALRKEHGDTFFTGAVRELMVSRSSATWSSSSVDTSAAAPADASVQPTSHDAVIITEGDLADRKYSSLGDLSVTVNKLTVFHPAPTREMVNQKLKEEAAKLGADAVILVRYGTVGMSLVSYGSLEGKGRAIKFAK